MTVKRVRPLVLIFTVIMIGAITAAPGQSKKTGKKTDASVQKEDETMARYPDRTGILLQLHLGVGLNAPGPLLGRYPGGTGPSYRLAGDFHASGSYFIKPNHAALLAVGTSSKEIGFRDSAGTGYWKSLFLDLSAGYQYYWRLFVFQGGLTYAVRLKEAPLFIETGGSTKSGTMPDIRQNNYFAAFTGVGIIYDLNKALFLTLNARVSWAFTPAIEGTWPTAISSSGAILGTDSIKLVPVNFGISAGMSYRL